MSRREVASRLVVLEAGVCRAGGSCSLVLGLVWGRFNRLLCLACICRAHHKEHRACATLDYQTVSVGWVAHTTDAGPAHKVDEGCLLVSGDWLGEKKGGARCRASKSTCCSVSVLRRQKPDGERVDGDWW